MQRGPFELVRLGYWERRRPRLPVGRAYFWIREWSGEVAGGDVCAPSTKSGDPDESDYNPDAGIPMRNLDAESRCWNPDAGIAMLESRCWNPDAGLRGSKIGCWFIWFLTRSVS